ncbi:MAG: DUF4321 domain-containing protein [Synergistaceae bacterium]|nr:DUF4321 domain-containing protein [Synergistaceae bacterium]
MALAKLGRSGRLRWGIILLFLIMGTWLGFFLQRFSATSALFTNFIDFSMDVKQIDLIILKFGFHLALKINLGTIIGAIAGIGVSR